MSRSGYNDDIEQWALIRWRGAVASAIRGKRGQAFLREMLAALDALKERRLIANDLTKDGEVCALGAVARQRSLPVEDIDPYDYERLATSFGISQAMAQEIMYINDERVWLAPDDHRVREEVRFNIVRKWVVDNLAALRERPAP